MARTKAPFIFATCISSGLALVFSVVALGTDQWVTGSVDLNSAATSTTGNEVNYGLFTGVYKRTLLTTMEYSLLPACNYGENKCAMLCGDSDLRALYLSFLLEGISIGEGYSSCSARSQRISNQNSSVEESVSRQTRAETSSGFINSGARLSTIIFLVLSCVAGVISTVFALWNTVANPVESIFNVFGLIIYNSTAACLTFIVIIIWGVQFAVTLAENIGIYDTIIQTGNSDGLSSLGYSYWMNVVALLLYISSICILLARQYLINKEPQNIVNLEGDKNDAIILF